MDNGHPLLIFLVFDLYLSQKSFPTQVQIFRDIVESARYELKTLVERTGFFSLIIFEKDSFNRQMTSDLLKCLFDFS